ncbi:MAG: hypothetical protein JNK48_26070 [Bryobacterales bacterium]|nr:hypothetical protein [Bryobacterales bacterium]
MKQTIATILVLAGWSATLPAQTIRSITNAASLAPAGAPHAAIAQGAQMAILGADIGPAEPAVASAFPYPTTDGLGGVTVKVTVGGTTADAILVSASARKVVAVVPSNVPTGTGEVTLTFDGKPVKAPVTIVATSFGVFDLSGAGTGPARLKNADGADVTFTAPARPGQQITLQGTGLGAVTGDEAGSALTDALPAEVEIYIGGKKANVVSKARAGTAPGVDQIVFEVPEGVSGCFQAIAVLAGGRTSNFVTASVAADGPCSDPGGLTPADFERISVQAEYRTGGVTIVRSSQTVQGFDITGETATGSFSKIKISGTVAIQNFGGNPSLGSCIVSYFSPIDPGSLEVDVQTLDAGPALTLTGPKGAKQLEKREGVYNATLSQALPNIPGLPTLPGASGPYLDPGEYTVTGPGGADVGAFTAKITLGPPLNWTNRATVGNDGANTIDRTKPVTFTWTGGRETETVSILGTSLQQNPQFIATFRCLERAPVGTFTVPAWVLSALPPSATGTLSVGTNAEPVRFEVSGVDTATLATSSSSGRTIAIR